jgi:tetratricopeptide (TPR) repeat protein
MKPNALTSDAYLVSFHRNSPMLNPRYLLPLVICQGLIGFAQTKDEVRPLEPGQIVEREIAGGQTHTYQITLQTGQFARVMVEQKGVDVELTLIGPDGNPARETNLNSVGGQESLSLLAVRDGRRRLALRAWSPDAAPGVYRLRMEFREAATDQDRRRVAAELTLAEAGQSRGDAAVEKLRQALAEWREVGDRYWEAFTLNSLALAARRQGRFQESIEFGEQALQISRLLADRVGEATALSAIGFAHSIMGSHERAIAYFEQAIAIRREAKLRAGEASSLSDLGVANDLMSRFDRAIDYFEQSLQIARELKDRLVESRALHNMGEVHLEMGRFERAIELYEAALTIHRERKDLFAQGATLDGLGQAFNRLGQVDRGIEFQEQALHIRRELKDRNGEGVTLYGLGLGYRALGEQALAISREVKNRLSEASSLNRLGATAFDMGRPDQAAEYQQQALRIWGEIKERHGEATALNSLGNIADFLGRYEQAIDLYERALAIFREVKNRDGERDPLHNLSIVYRRLNMPDKAIERLEESLAISREVKNRGSEAHDLHGLGDVYLAQGRAGQAVERYEQALAISREVKDRFAEGTVLSSIGHAYLAMGRHDVASRYLDQSLAINREVEDRPGEGNTLAGLGRVYKLSGQSEKAVSCFQQALAIHRETQDLARETETLYNLAEVEREMGRLDQARALIEECLRLAESLRARIYSPERRVSYRSSAQTYHEFYIDLLMRLHMADPGRGYDALAAQASERARARGLIEMLAESRADIRRGVDAALLERERAIAWQINVKARQLAERPKPEQAAILKSEISRLEDEYQQAQTAIRRASPRYAALAFAQPLTLSEIQQQLDEKTLLLEYSLGAERSYLWAITRNSLDSYELPEREQIEQSARSVYDLMAARGRRLRGETPQRRRARVASADSQLPQAARRLSRILLSPVAAKLGDNLLVIVADGALQYLPFAMLPVPETEGRRDREARGRRDGETEREPSPRLSVSPSLRPFMPLVVNHEVVTLPSASALAAHRRELAGREPAPNGVAVIADPVFSAGDERMKTVMAKIEAGTPSPDAGQNLASTRIIEHLAEDSARAASIPRLPYTRQEADRILAVARASTNLAALDFKANRATATSAELSRYRYVHFATHGLLDSERPGLSALALSLVDEKGKPQDGFLRAHEIYNLNLPAELVTLSACRTGLGKETKGEGLVGLTRGFMYAGAARIVVSLWNVNDKATSELMERFYRKMLKEGRRPAAALRSAQVEMWRSSQWRAPYFWAAFTLQGEWR